MKVGSIELESFIPGLSLSALWQIAHVAAELSMAFMALKSLQATISSIFFARRIMVADEFPCFSKIVVNPRLRGPTCALVKGHSLAKHKRSKTVREKKISSE